MISKYEIYIEILALLGLKVSKSQICEIFDIRPKEAELFLKEVSSSYFIEDTKYIFTSNKNVKDIVTLEDFVKATYYLWNNDELNKGEIEKLRYKLNEYNGITFGNFSEFVFILGDYSKTENNEKFELKLYAAFVDFLREVHYPSKKKYFVRAVLKISKLEFLRGISQRETLLLQEEAIALITESNITSDDALMLLYAGVNEHFTGNSEKGERLRAKGIKYLESFDFDTVEEEAAPFIIWDYYLSGNFNNTIGYYEGNILPFENRNKKEVFSMAYPPIIFSYFFIGENDMAIALGEKIYKRAVDNGEYQASMLVKASIARACIYANRSEYAEELLNEVLEYSQKTDYGWGMYYALFGFALKYYLEGNYEESRDKINDAIIAAKRHGFSPINASPFILEMLRIIDKYNLKRIEDFDYEKKLNEYVRSKNIHMAGIAYRHIAMRTSREHEKLRLILDNLRISTAFLERSGDKHELALTKIEIAKIYNQLNDRENTVNNATSAWLLLNEENYHVFPAELVSYVDNTIESTNISILLDTIWYELRNIIDNEKLVVRLMMSLARTLKMETGAFVLFDDSDARITYALNIEIDDLEDVRFKRAVETAILAKEKKEIIYRKTNLNERCYICFPFVNEKDKVGCALYFESNKDRLILKAEQIDILKDFVARISIVLADSYRFLKNNTSPEKDDNELAESLVNQRAYWQSEDEKIMLINKQIPRIAKTNVPVLITGETGAGKEVFARQIYEESDYKKAFIRVNCGAIPESLIESELFGYEKGSFTGASGMKKGYFELAEDGTIFLDEIGELSLAAQVKLLRILQEHEFMRVGGTTSIKVNFRLIVATNKNLEEEVNKGRFRGDLFYRLNIVQINIPPLRERKNDILSLTDFFIKKYSSEMKKDARIIDEASKERILNYEWPGNVRELENVVQKSVLFSDGKEINILFDEDKKLENSISTEVEISHTDTIDSYKTLEEVEKEYIEKIIKICGGKISGENSACSILGLKRTTLISKMEKLGIKYKRNGGRMT